MKPINKNAAVEARGVPETDQLGGKVNRENTLTKDSRQARRGGRRSRRKGDRIEREMVSRHAAIEIQAERYPLSGVTRFRGSGHDIDIYAFGEDEPAPVAEVKSRKNGSGFATIESWLADNAALILRRNNADPLVCVSWRVWAAASASAPMNDGISSSAIMRSRLPARRASQTFSFEIAGLRYHATVSRFTEGDRVAEVFLSSHKLGSQADANARDAAVAARVALQYGRPPDVLRNALLRDSRGGPASPLGMALDIAAQQETASAP
jgi:hypothetical protein